MLTKKSDGNISCCFDTFEIHPIVAIYGFLWYLNSLYGIVLMIIEYQSECFFEWCGVCIVNATIPIIWLIIISMVDSCCIKYWSLKKWHRRHYGAAFLYFAIFTNQLLIFGTLCFYGFSVWTTIGSPACNASQHLLYGFIILISTSTILILWIGLYQFYAATKYLCTYTAVLDVKRRQENSTIGLKHNGCKNGKNGGNGKLMGRLKSNGRKHRNSLESSSVNLSTMSFSYIHTIYRYGEEAPIHVKPDDDENDGLQHEANKVSTNALDLNVNMPHIPQKREHIDEDGNIATYPPPPSPPRPISPQISDIVMNESHKITPLPSEHAELMEFNTEEQVMHDIVDETKLTLNEEKLSGEDEDDDEEFESKEMSEDSESKTPSKSTTHIVIAGIVIPTRRFTKIGHGKNKQHNHKRYKSVKKQEEDLCEQKDLEQSELTIQVSDRRGGEERESNNLFSLPLIGRAIRITSNYFDRLKEDPSTADLCIICYDSFKNDEYLAKLKCNHVFHKNCIRIWLANNHSCPLCMFDEKNLNLKFYALKLNKNI